MVLLILINTNVQELFRLLPKGYEGGVLVVLMISLLKLYNGFLGNNSAIINNSKYYKVILPISLGMATAVYFLNKLFYYELEMGTNGLALATLIVILTANTIKLLFVKKKFRMTPFTDKSWKMIFIITILYFIFNYWNFPIDDIFIGKFPIHPIINILLKSILIVLVYLFLVIKLNISDELSRLFRRYIYK